VLHVVPAQQDELALPVEVVDVHDPEPGLARASAVLPRKHEAPAGQPAEHEGEQGQEREDDHEGEQVLDRRRIAEPELRQHDELSAVVEPEPVPEKARAAPPLWDRARAGKARARTPISRAGRHGATRLTKGEGLIPLQSPGRPPAFTPH
jgi:hypothetical protein